MMVDVIDVATDAKDTYPDRSSYITRRGPVGAKVLIRRRTSEIGRREKVGQHAATDLLAVSAGIGPLLEFQKQAAAENKSARAMVLVFTSILLNSLTNGPEDVANGSDTKV